MASISLGLNELEVHAAVPGANGVSAGSFTRASAAGTHRFVNIQDTQFWYIMNNYPQMT